MSDLKVSSGDPIRAKDWNRIVDLVTGSQSGGTAAVGSMSQVLARVSNDSGRDYDIGEILQLDGFTGPTASPPYEAISSLLYSADQPTWHTAISMPAVAAEPIPDGETGVAVVFGQCVIAVTSTATGDYVMTDSTTTYAGTLSTGGFARFLGRIDDDFVLGCIGHGSNLWRYKLTQASQAPAVTTAKLVDLAGTDYATAVNISDPLSLMDDQVADDTGFCISVGNAFYAIQGPC